MPVFVKVITPYGSKYNVNLAVGSDHDSMEVCADTITKFMKHVYGPTYKYICDRGTLKDSSKMSILYTQIMLLHECKGISRLRSTADKLEKMISKNYHSIDPEDKCRMYELFPFDYLRTIASL